jgi:GAF domain-containing protein
MRVGRRVRPWREEAAVPVDHEAVVSSLHALLAVVDVPEPTDVNALSRRLQQVVTTAGQVLDVDGVGLMLLDEHDNLRVVGASDPAGAALEEGQQQLGLGPGVDCVRSGQTVAVDDLSAGAYPALWKVLREPHLGSVGRVASDQEASAPPPGTQAPVVVRAVLSVPVRVREQVVGTLNALRGEPLGWTAAHIRAVEAYAGIVAVLLRLGDQARQAVWDGSRPGQE